MEKISKRATAIAIMAANADKAMDEVVAMIAAANEITVANAKSYYRWIVQNGMAAGSIEKPARVVKEKVAKVKAEKVVKAPQPHWRRNLRLPVANADELAKIKAANLQRMKEVTTKSRQFLPGQVANGKKSAAPVDPDEARAEVDNILNGLDSFKAPAFLTKDQIRSLV